MPTTRPFSTRRAQPWRWTIILLVLLTLAPAAALAQDTGTADTNSPPAAGSPPLVASESTLVFRGNTGASVGRTFILKDVDGSVGNVRISAGDLLEKDGRIILATQITVDPAAIEDLDDEQTVTVTVDPGAAKSGTYTGTLSVWYSAPPTATVQTTPLTIGLQVTLNAVPSVSADPGSNNQTLFATTTDMPFINVPKAPTVGTSSVLGELPIALIESASEPARVIQAEVLPVRNSEGLTLPQGVVSIDNPRGEPLKIPPNGAATLSLAVAGSSLPAGTYAGSVRILVENQSTVVSVPFTMKLKDGPVWAFLVLVASLVVGVAVGWYNRRGGPARENVSKIDAHRKRLHENPGHLQIEEHNQATDLLNEAMNAVRYQEPQTVVDARLKTFTDYVDEQTKAVREFRESIGAVRQKIEALSGADEVQRTLLEKIKELQQDVEASKLESLAGGQRRLKAIEGELDALRTMMQERIDDLLATAQELTLGAAARDGLTQRLDALSERLAAAQPDAFGSINAAIDTVETELLDLENLQDVMAEAQQQAAQRGLSAAAGAFDTATTVAELRSQLEALRSQLMATPADGAAVMTTPPFDMPNPMPPAAISLDDLNSGQARAAAREPAPKDLLGKKFARSIYWRTALIQGLVYFFALLVGWAALYLPNTTFGARPEDYITLFLWGATVNVVAGQQIKLEAIRGHKVQEVKRDPQTPAEEP